MRVNSGSFQQRYRRRTYPATILITAATAAVGAIAYARPELSHQLQRDAAARHDGHAWRLISPLLIQNFGWGQYAFNIAGSLLVGVAVERLYGALRWVLIYAVAGVAGVMAANHWLPLEHGSGSSDAVAGLIGALGVALLLGRPLPWWPGGLYAVFFAAYLTGSDLGPKILGGQLHHAAGPIVGSVLGSVTALLAANLRRFDRLGAYRALIVLATVAGAAAMTALQDTHGVGLLVGLGLGLLMPAYRTEARAAMRSEGVALLPAPDTRESPSSAR
nr:rhomboid family intramembrane serine protease [Catenulispora sp.]